ncbi:hypothetical protein BH23ACT8_BH23ACT8_15620 [soil metagenome]
MRGLADTVSGSCAMRGLVDTVSGFLRHARPGRHRVGMAATGQEASTTGSTDSAVKGSVVAVPSLRTRTLRSRLTTARRR